MMTSRLATPPGQIPLENDQYGFHLPQKVAKSWKTLEQTCRQISSVLHTSFCQDHPKANLIHLPPAKPSDFGYFGTHPSEEIAQSAISKSLDAFVILFAYVSFCITICRAEDDPASVSLLTSESKPRWLRLLSDSRRSKLHPESVQLLVDSPIADFTTVPQRLGAIINVSRCSWLHLVPCMINAKVPIWLYWGVPPAFCQPLVDKALIFAPRSHPQSKASPALPPSQPAGPSAPSGHAGPGQLPGETWKEFITRQNERRKAKLKNESGQHRQARQGRELMAEKQQCPGKKGSTVYIWEQDNGVWTRTLLHRGEVEGYWGQYRSSQKIDNSFDNCWDLCFQFDEGTAGEVEYEYDSNDSDNDIVPHRQKQAQRPPTPKNRRSSGALDFSPMAVDPTPPAVPIPAQVASDSLPTVVDPTPLPVLSPAQVASDPLPTVVDPTPLLASSPAQVASDLLPTVVDPTSPPISLTMPAQVASDPLPMVVDSVDSTPLPDSSPAQVAIYDLQHPDPQFKGDFVGADELEDGENPYDASRQDVLNAYSFAPLNLEPMPITTLDDLLYYRYGFSLNERYYTGIPSSFNAGTYTFRSWPEICRAVGGQDLESSVLNRAAIEDFLSILAACRNPFKDVPGKYWDLSPLGQNPIADLSRVYISIDERASGKFFILPHPRFLHADRDTSWFLSVDSMTALECIRRGLGPHTIDIANFFITHGIRFRTYQCIPNSPNSNIPPVRPQCRYLGYRSLNYSFDLADFAGYEVLRDSFLRSQPHGPLALREGGIIARLAREVLPNSNALSGPSSEALGGHCACLVCDDDKIYVEDEFSDAELRLICGTYVLGDAHHTGMRMFPK